VIMPRVDVETLLSPRLYTYEQLEQAITIAMILGRGKFLLVEPPKR
jgi:hypothetical protein